MKIKDLIFNVILIAGIAMGVSYLIRNHASLDASALRNMPAVQRLPLEKIGKVTGYVSGFYKNVRYRMKENNAPEKNQISLLFQSLYDEANSGDKSYDNPIGLSYSPPQKGTCAPGQSPADCFVAPQINAYRDFTGKLDLGR